MSRLNRPLIAQCDPRPADPPARAAGAAGTLRRGLCVALAATLALTPPLGAFAADPKAASFSSSLPNLGDSSSDDLSPLAERRLGEDIMRQIRAASDDLDDAETVEYLNQFAAALTSLAPPGSPSFEFFAVKDPSINAFALPGGFIGVHTGLLLASQSESELASVLGHEMGHVTQRHIARSISSQRESSLITLGALALAILAARSGNAQVMQAATAGGIGFSIQNQLSFSRDAEREADRVGLQFLQDSGFDVNGMVDFFGRLQNASRYYERAAPAYVRTHPLTTERIADIQNRIRDVRYRQRVDSPEFQLMRARIRVLQNDSGQGLRDVRQAFEEQLRSGQNWSQPSAHYGLALVLQRQRDLTGARTELATARQLLPVRSPMIEKFGIELTQEAGDRVGAIGLARAARLAFPQSRMLAQAYAGALQFDNRHVDALAFLREQILLYRQEVMLHVMMAKSYAALRNDLLQHKSLAESYFLGGNLRAALNQLQLARRAGGSDFYESSQIDARTREIQALIAEREKSAKDAGKR